jgi:alkanesulfonate monooxygenase SsuD/methylene tetrahydromethanopterin reductase-like flavin-dependent oxidoreductase (luciferase family)
VPRWPESSVCPLLSPTIFSAENTIPALALYRESFRPSTVLDHPHALIGVAVIAADSDERARRLAAPGLLSFRRLRTGHPGPLPSPEEPAEYRYTPSERRVVEHRLANQVLGSPETVRRGLEDLLSATDAREVMVTTMLYDHSDRVRCYQLVAHLAALEDRSAATAVRAV